MPVISFRTSLTFHQSSDMSSWPDDNADETRDMTFQYHFTSVGRQSHDQIPNGRWLITERTIC